jgi:hypothetical protein
MDIASALALFQQLSNPGGFAHPIKAKVKPDAAVLKRIWLANR